MIKSSSGLLLVFVCVIILYTSVSGFAVTLAVEHGLLLLHTICIGEENFMMYGKLEKITDEADLDYDYYKVTTVLTYKAQAANWFKNVVAVWTADGEKAELLDYMPCTQPPGSSSFTIGIPGFSMSFKSDSPGAWKVYSDDCSEDIWACQKVDWEMIFELTYCWKHLETTSLWKVPKNAEAALVEVHTFLTTAAGGCNYKSTCTTTYELPTLRFDINQLDPSAPE